MIYLHISKKENLDFFYEDLFHFFPTTIQDLEISTVSFYGVEEPVLEEVLQKIFINSFCISGLHKQHREKIDFAQPNFDSVFEFVIYDTLKKIPLSSFDLICNANDVLKKNFSEVNYFIQTLKKYRLYKKYGKNIRLTPPFLWDIFTDGTINKKNANYIMENSKFVSIPNIGVGGIGQFAITFIHKNNFSLLQKLQNLANEKNMGLFIVKNINEIPSY